MCTFSQSIQRSLVLFYRFGYDSALNILTPTTTHTSGAYAHTGRSSASAGLTSVAETSVRGRSKTARAAPTSLARNPPDIFLYPFCFHQTPSHRQLKNDDDGAATHDGPRRGHRRQHIHRWNGRERLQRTEGEWQREGPEGGR